MKEYFLILIGTGSAMSIVDALVQGNSNLKIAVIDKDDPGGICLTRGCIPSKILLYPAELVRIIEESGKFGIDLDLKKIDFMKVMERMWSLVTPKINHIREGLSHLKNVDYYHGVAEFVSPYTIRVNDNIITSKMIILCLGSKPLIPPMKGLEDVGYYTSDTILGINTLPESIAVVGGGYIAAEYGHFLSAMGSKVTVIGRNPQFLPDEEPEVSALAKRELQKHMTIFTNHEALTAEKTSTGQKRIIAVDREGGKTIDVISEEILVATGRASNINLLHPERTGIKIDAHGWVIVNDYLETSLPNVWALGDANGKYPFKHKANYETRIVYYNAILKKKINVDYHAIPHAVFTYPEIASVGLRESEAIQIFGLGNVLIGIQRYQDTAKGDAMAIKDYFAKVIVEKRTMKILGAHIIGPHVSILIQEIINLMYTPTQTAEPLTQGMHIHPSLSEVVEGAFHTLMIPEQYHHLIEHHYELPLK
ncbi:MAG: dihydrolipoyl dehydrogenase [Candidatus Bathyarchaeota archaeon]